MSDCILNGVRGRAPGLHSVPGGKIQENTDSLRLMPYINSLTRSPAPAARLRPEV